MCFGGAKQPQIVYQGPSDADLASSRASLDSYRTDMAAQQASFQQMLQSQIDSANKQTASLQAEYTKDATAAEAAAKAETTKAQAAALNNGYTAVTAMQSAPAGETTVAIQPKKKPSNTLRIASNAVEASAGTGLNIGV